MFRSKSFILAVSCLALAALDVSGQSPVRDIPNPTAPRLAGTGWMGRENLQGYGDLRFRFLNNNQVIMVDEQATTTGAYGQNGNQVTLRFYDGQTVYSGTIQGNRMSGSARGPNGQTWSWAVTLYSGSGGSSPTSPVR